MVYISLSVIFRQPVLSQHNLLRTAALTHYNHATCIDIGRIEGGDGGCMNQSAGGVVDAYRSVGSIVVGCAYRINAGRNAFEVVIDFASIGMMHHYHLMIPAILLVVAALYFKLQNIDVECAIALSAVAPIDVHVTILVVAVER